MSYEPTPSRNRQHQSRPGSQRRSTRAARYEDPFAEANDYRYTDTRSASSRTYRDEQRGTRSHDAHRTGAYGRSYDASDERIEDYRDASRYASRGSSSRTRRSSRDAASPRSRQRTDRTHDRSNPSTRRDRAASMRNASDNRRPLVICVIILLILDIALAIGIYSCGASLDEQAAANTTQSGQTAQTAQTTQTSAQSGGA